MNRIPYAGLIISSVGSLIIIFWAMWKVVELLELPLIIKIGLMLLVGGIIITIASLIRERSQDIKKETYLK